MPSKDYQRPATLYLYGPKAVLQNCLTLGEFRLQPATDQNPGALAHAPGIRLNSAMAPNFLTLGFAPVWDESLFNAGSDACLVIHNTEAFGERLHRAVGRALPNWAGIDGAVSYGKRSPLGAIFTRPAAQAAQQSWQFAWRPMQPTITLNPITVKLGSIEEFAEIRTRGAR
ncbi:hypothetical protein [Herminiimonas sp. CN]|uniref:hypothetical protein n=1 Tax=Herminiimonas sp. CN TaxID=1349818 RepID=UPI00047303D2|nr:hypothetical protein [Herminiimonas sp. CN]